MQETDEGLENHDPANTQWQRDLSVSHNKMGGVMVADGDGPGSLAAYQAGLTTAAGLAIGSAHSSGQASTISQFRTSSSSPTTQRQR